MLTSKFLAIAELPAMTFFSIRSKLLERAAIGSSFLARYFRAHPASPLRRWPKRIRVRWRLHVKLCVTESLPPTYIEPSLTHLQDKASRLDIFLATASARLCWNIPRSAQRVTSR